MKTEHPLALATEVYLRCRVPGDEPQQREDCAALAATGLFSNRHLEAITGLPETQVARISGKTDRTGGRLSTHTLPLLLAASQDFDRGRLNERLLRCVLEKGTSPRMIAKLTRVPVRTLYRLSA